MGKRKNRKYNNDFKLRAVKLCLETNKPDAEIARDLGVQQTTLSTWKQKYLKNQTQAFSGNNGFGADLSANLMIELFEDIT